MTLVSSFSSPTMASRSGTADLARVSCFHCRNSKRRCDKTLPACELCCRRGVECRYPRRRGQRSASPQDISNLQDEATSAGSAPTLVQAGPTTPSTPSTAFAVSTAIRFLAPDLFGELRLQIPRLEWDVPADVALQLGDRQQIHDVTVTFLRMTRPWMPVVSGKRHLAAVLSPLLTPLRRPRALLALCMKLCCLSVEDRSRNGERHPLYLLVKQFYAEVERVEEPCLEVMQAALFIAVFEMGDAIYPAAYLTVGAMIRYGLSMGMDKINVERMGVITGAFTGAPWQDIEEMRRVWWGALILDRLLNVSHPSRSLTSADPMFDDFLPVDDDSFFDATSKPEDATRISEAFGFKMGSFARLCQATYLISQVLALIRKPSPDARDSALSSSRDAVQLCRTLESLVRANEYEVTTRRLAFCSQSLVSYIGVMLLQEHHWDETRFFPTHGAKQTTYTETHSALETLDRVSKTLREAGLEAKEDLESGNCTLFLVYLLYRALLVLTTIGRDQIGTEIQEKKESLKWLLARTRSRWPVAGGCRASIFYMTLIDISKGVYENILAAKEAMMMAEAASGQGRQSTNP
ncbi:Transcription factor [Moelleriella libera RCEF 2490]|uniref:Transcription factor n=1 Tax=Moelleriella libera RCEF 2490 TaxID=1081109 RepID=A0A167ZER3_9HYPO|nr:Transcription factor [Moelleriella libera RCEF 2490]